MKKLITLILAIVIMISGFAAVDRAESADVVMINTETASPINWAQTWEWMYYYFNWYVNNTMPDFRVRTVKVCYGSASAYTYNRASVHFTTENIGGNMGIAAGSRLYYTVKVGHSALGYNSAVPYWGQPVSVYDWQYISDRWKANVGTVQINMNYIKSPKEINYANNISTWSVNTTDYKLDGCYDLVQVN